MGPSSAVIGTQRTGVVWGDKSGIKAGGLHDAFGCGRASFPVGEVTDSFSGTFSTGAGWPQVDATRW